MPKSSLWGRNGAPHWRASNLVKCVEAVQQPKDKSANAKVAALHLTAEERKTCAKAILAWYKKLQAAEKATAKKS